MDTVIEVFVNDNNEAESLQITWTYDDFYSLSTVSDMGLDPDGDGRLTPEENAELSGFDMKWIEGFEGDTYARMGDKPLVLSGPRDWTARYEGGRLISTHMRDLEHPVKIGAEPLVIRAYDPTYYVAHFIDPPATVSGGSGCQAMIFGHDENAAEAALQAALQNYNPDMNPEADFPAVGAIFSDEVQVTCGAS